MRVDPSDDYLKRRADAFALPIPVWLPFLLLALFLVIDIIERYK